MPTGTANIDQLIDKIDDLIDTLNSGGGTGGNGGSSGRPRRPSTNPYDPRRQRVLRDRDAMDTLTGGRSRSFRQSGKSMQNVGSFLSKQGGALGKFGGAISKAGGLLTKFAGPIGIAIQALELLGQAAKATAEAYAKAQDIQNQKNTALTQRNINTAKNQAEELVDEYKTAATKGLNKLNTESALAIERQSIENQRIIASTQAKIGGVIGNINDTAWEALSAMTDYNASMQKYDIRAAKERAKTERANVREDINLYGRSQGRERAREQIELDANAAIARLNADAQDYIREHPYATAAAGMFGGGADDQFRANNTQTVTVGGQAQSSSEDGANQYMTLNSKTAMARNSLNGLPIVGGIFENANAAHDITDRANMEEKLTNAQNDLAARTAQTEIHTEMRNTVVEAVHSIEDNVADTTTTIKEAAIDTRATIEKSYQQMSRTVEQTALDHQNYSYQSGIGKGLVDPQQLRSYSLAMGYIAADVSKQFGLKMQEVYDIQNKVFADTGRTKIVGDVDMHKLAAMGRYLGDNGLSAEIAGSMEIFNTGVSASVDTMYEMARSVNKIGLDGRKYTREAVENLKLAQKYDFKNGVNGMLKMSKWAQEVRFNMDSLAAILEKIQTGGLEGNITNAAKMQVLGGRFAMAADPLAMIYEGFNSPEELAERYNSALSGMGVFNRATGKVDFSMSEQMIMRGFANITGQDLADVRNQSSYHLKKNKVKGSINGNAGLTPEQEQFLINQSYWDQDEKKWKVTGIDGKAIDVANINSENISNVQANDYEGKVEQAIEKTMDWQSKIMGLQENQLSLLSLGITGDDTLFREMQERYNSSEDLFKTEFESFMTIVSNNMAESTKAFKTLSEDMLTPEQVAAENLQAINENSTAIRGQLSVLSRQLIDSNDTALLQSILAMAETSASAQGFNGATLQTTNGKKYDTRVLMDYGIMSPTGQSASAGWVFSKDATKMANMFGREYQNSSNWIVNNTEQQWLNARDYYGGRFNRHSDGIMSAQGTPILSAASSITPINDGAIQLAQSDPQDSAIFAKTGGPFDKLFNGIIGEVDAIHDFVAKQGEVDTSASNTPIVENPTTVVPRNAEVSPEVLPPRTVTPSEWGGNSSPNQGVQISFQPLKIEGKIELGMNGQSLDITKEIANNPQFIRQLTQLISEGISRNINGGKTVYTGGQLVGGLGFAGS